MTQGGLLMWIGFSAVVLTIMVIDLGVLHRRSHVVRMREALLMTSLCISLALSFNVAIYFWHGWKPAMEFFTGYLLEISLSVDNLFVFLVIFSYFAVPREVQHKVLFWGILGALVMRGIFIAVGAILLARWHWLIYVFGAILLYTGFQMLISGEKEIEPEKNPVIRLARRHLRVTAEYAGAKFFVRIDGVLWATPLFLVLLFVETTDLIFAVDSIPAIFGITQDPFIIFTSNVFAILGLRSMFFALSGLMHLFHLLKYGLAIILMFIGAKMLAGMAHVHLPLPLTLGVVGGILVLSVLLSVLFPARGAAHSPGPATPESSD